MAAGNCFFKALFDVKKKQQQKNKIQLRSIKTEIVKYFVFVQL